MTIQRKRVAKRLATGLVAGALALGGLAISGASPAGAANPDWSVLDSRIGGADRYETAVLVAEDRGWSNLIIASGENPADALAASAIVEAEDAAILLTMSDGLPEIVADYLDENDDFAGDVYIVGGESAISADIEDAIGDLMPDATVTRVAGDNRYETAAEINAMLGIPDGAIIVNGADGRWPDALSIGQVAALLEWPIIVTGNGGLNNVATEQIDNLLLDNEDASFLLIGGTTVMPQSVEDYLLDEGVSAGSIRRLGGADRYGTNVLVNAWILEGGATALLSAFTGGALNNSTAEAPLGLLYAFDAAGADSGAGYGVTLVSGESPWDALSATGLVQASEHHLVLTKKDSLPPFTAVAAGLLAQLGGPQEVSIIGGPNAVSNTVKNAFFAAVNTDAPAPTISGCTHGAPWITVDLVGADSASKNAGIVVEVDADDGSDVAVDIEESESLLYPAGTHYTVVFDDYTLEPDDVVTVAVDTESDMFQAVDVAECVVTEDETDPTITMEVLSDSIIFTASEPVTPGDLAVTTVTTDGEETVFSGEDTQGEEATWSILPASTNDLALFLATGYSSKWIASNLGADPTADDYEATFTASSRYYLAEDSFADLVDLTNASASDRAAADSTDPTMTKLAAVCVNQTSASWNLNAETTLYFGNMGAVGAVGPSPTGISGNDWVVELVDDRGAEAPSVSSDSAEQTLTISFDLGRHTIAQLYREMVDAGVGGLLGSWSIETADFTGTIDEDDADALEITPGTKDCSVILAPSEPVIADWSLTDLEGDAGDLEDLGFAVDLFVLTFEDVDEADYEVEINGEDEDGDTVAFFSDVSGNAGAFRLTFTI